MPTTLIRGKMEGWARIRLAGQTDWKRVWLSVQAGSGEHDVAPAAPTANPTLKKKRISNLFTREPSEVSNSFALPPKPMIAAYTSPKPKDKKKAILTIHGVLQAFSVYPERPELISRSTLIKVEGKFGEEEMAANLKNLEGWILIMPELESNLNEAAEMLKWIVGTWLFEGKLRGIF